MRMMLAAPHALLYLRARSCIALRLDEEHMASQVAFFFVVALLRVALVAAQDQDFSKVQIKVTKVSGNIYMLEGIGRQHRRLCGR